MCTTRGRRRTRAQRDTEGPRGAQGPGGPESSGGPGGPGDPKEAQGTQGAQDSPGPPQEATSQILEKDGSLKIVISLLTLYYWFIDLGGHPRGEYTEASNVEKLVGFCCWTTDR